MVQWLYRHCSKILHIILSCSYAGFKILNAIEGTSFFSVSRAIFSYPCKLLNVIVCDNSVWMSQNKLKLNNDKTEVILFGSNKNLAELNIKSLSVAGTDVSVASEPVRNLGAMFDSQLNMVPHVKSVVKKSSFHLRNIGKARRVLTEDATKTVMQSLVMSRLDYCSALLIGIQQDLIAKLQRLQNSAARIVSRTRKYEHITPLLIKLHWLPIKFRIQF